MTAPPVSPGRKLVLIGGAVTAAIGVGVFAAALMGSDPGRIAGDAVEAKATLLAQSTGTGYVPSSPYSKSPVPEYFDTFSFTDRSGRRRDGYDEVSLPFYTAYRTGATVDAYYYPDAPQRAVLGTPLRLGPHGLQYGTQIGTALVLAGFLGMAVNIDLILAGIGLSKTRLRRLPGPKRQGKDRANARN